MSLQSLLSELRTRQILVWVDGEKLRYRTTDGALPTDLRHRIKQYRQEMIEFLQQDNPSTTDSRSIPIVSRDTTLPLSFAEEGMWFISSLNADKPVFQAHYAYRINGQLDVHLLERCLVHLVSRHEILRTSYVFEDSVLCRKIEDADSFRLAHSDIKPDAVSFIDDKVQQLLLAEKNKKIDLTTEFCFQARLIRLPSDQFILSIKLHHIIYDDQSMSLLWQELYRIYDDLVNSRPLKLSLSPLQYADFACWQRSVYTTVVEKGLSYWKKKLADVPQFITLPADHPRPLVQSYSGAQLLRALSDAELVGLDGLCHKSNVTRFMALLSLFSLLLHRYSGQSTILIGSPVSNRRSSELESVLGCFLDTIVLRADFNSKITFIDLLNNARNTTLEAFENQQIPFEKIVELLKPDRNQGCHPIFQVMFNFLQDRESESGLKLPGLDIEKIGKASAAVSADFDLKLTIVEKQGQLNCSFVYNTDLFEENTIARMADHFKSLLNAALKNPEASVSTYSILTEAEQRQMLYDWNDTDVGYPLNVCLARLFEQQVQSTPTRVALLQAATMITYSELNDRANQLAHYLLSIGVETQSVVGVHLERSPEVTIALLAIFKINAVYLPLDSEYPAARLHRMLDSGNAQCLISVEELNQKLDYAISKRVLLDGDHDLLETMPRCNQAIHCSAEDLAYIVFTSGSTGIPKGVNVSHRQILNRMHWMWRNYPFVAGDVSCQKTAISFVDSLWELLGPLLQGSSSVILSASSSKDPVLFLKQLAQQNISRLWLVPTLLHLLLETAKKRNLTLPALNFVVVSGEPLPSALAADVFREWPQVSLYNLYGTSEAWDSTWCEVADVDYASLAVPIGKPIDNTQIHILDDQLNPVPIGVCGQLFVSGDGLADSFIEASTLDPIGFVQKPWDTDHRMYGSGDYARYLSDGTIDLLGRKNGNFNVRGYRVDPAEIENAICEIAGVGRACVIQKQIKDGMGMLVAFVQPNTGSVEPESIVETSLRIHLKARLPAYMIPNALHFLDEFPTTPSGKTDRLALKALEWEMPTAVPRSDDFPRSELEADILKIWRIVLHKESIGIHDNFFDLGGHSLMAVELFDKLSSIAGTSLELTTLFQASTVADQADIIRTVTTRKSQTSVVAIQPDGIKAPLFFVPPAGGTGLNYRRLSQYLGKQQPVYTFNLAKSGAAMLKFESVEDMAARLIVEMREVQPQGPYVVGGMCFGGLVAWEMARQLRQSRQPLACVILLDASLPVHGPEWVGVNRKLTLRTIVLNNFTELVTNKFNRQSRKKVFHRAVRKLFRRWNDRLQQFQELRYRHGRAWSSYTAAREDVDVIMICSKEFSDREKYLDRWKSLIGGYLDVDILSDSTHLELLVDNNVYMEIIGTKLHDYLDRKLNADIE